LAHQAGPQGHLSLLRTHAQRLRLLLLLGLQVACWRPLLSWLASCLLLLLLLVLLGLWWWELLVSPPCLLLRRQVRLLHCWLQHQRHCFCRWQLRALQALHHHCWWQQQVCRCPCWHWQQLHQHPLHLPLLWQLLLLLLLLLLLPSCGPSCSFQLARQMGWQMAWLRHLHWQQLLLGQTLLLLLCQPCWLAHLSCHRPLLQPSSRPRSWQGPRPLP
jgi:hypothetical protein